MYQAKNTGRGSYQFYKEDMNLAFQARKALERDLRKALANGELDVFYQPQIDARSNLIIGVEALVRWPHPERGMISPADFVPIAEECGLIVPLGEWVLETACRQNKMWQERGLPPVRVAVNLSAQQFLYRDLVASVMRVLETSGLDHGYLELEITEGILMRETEMTISTLRRLAELGIQIAVDDFGTGYSSMAYLKRFPVNKIKIDRALRDRCHHRSRRCRHRRRGDRPGARPGPDRGCRGCGDLRAGGTPAGARLRRAPGLLFRPTDDGRLVPGAPRRDERGAARTRGDAVDALARRGPLTPSRSRPSRAPAPGAAAARVTLGHAPAQPAIRHAHRPQPARPPATASGRR
jgi:EAL domain-containing protein (putative c-di-GMP-specific phosphodiesterase class I)